MSGETDKVQVTFGAEAAQLMGSLTDVRYALMGLMDPIRGIRQGLGELGEAFAAAFAVEKLTEFVSHMAEMEASVEHVKEELGMTAEEVSKFEYAAGAMGESSDSAANAMTRLERNITMAAQGQGRAAAAFGALGISVRNTDGSLKSANVVLEEMADRFSKAPDGIAKTAISLDLMGRGARDMLPVLNQGREGLEALGEEATRAGMVMTDQMARGGEETAMGLYELWEAVKGLGLELFNEFKPAIDATVAGLTEFVESMRDSLAEGGALHLVLQVLVQALQVIIAACAIVSGMLQDVWAVARGVLIGIEAIVITLGKALERLGKGDMEGVRSAFDAFGEAVPKIMQQVASSIADVQNQYDAMIRRLFDMGDLNERKNAVQQWQEDMRNSGKLDYDPTAMQGRVAQWREALQAMLAASNNFYGDLQPAELAYWEGIKSQYGLNKQEAAEVDSQIFELKRSLAQKDLQTQLSTLNAKQAAARDDYALQTSLEDQKLAILMKDYGQASSQYQNEFRKQEEMAKKHQDELNRIAMEGLNEQNKIHQQDLSYAKKVYDEEYQFGIINSQQLRSLMTQTENQSYQLELENLQRELQLDGLNAQSKQQTFNKIEELNEKHKLQMLDIDNEYLNQSRQMWQTFADSIESLESKMVGALWDTSQSWGQKMKKIFDDMVQSFEIDVMKMITQWAIFGSATANNNNSLMGHLMGGMMPNIGGGLASLVGLGGMGGGGAQGGNAALNQLTTALTGNTTATTTNSGGIINWIGQQVESIAQFLGLTTAATAQTVATTTDTTTTAGGLIPAIIGLTAAITANTMAQAGSGAGGLFADLTGSLGIAAFAEGSRMITTGGVAIIHSGEQIVPANSAGPWQAPAMSGMGGGAPGSVGGSSQQGPTFVYSPNVSSLNAKDTIAALNDPGVMRQWVANTQEYMANNPSTRGNF